jgi:3-isopropylmalate/(R)-2-methylmalate dehydratase small subunit
VVIASSFADIFKSNCTKIGLLPVQLTADECKAIADAGSAQVDLASQEVRWEGSDGMHTASFEIDPDIKHRLLEGLDDIALTVRHERDIDAFEAQRPEWLPRVR